jgi:hypothetical protein
MIVTVVRFTLPDPIDNDTARATFGTNASSYLDVPGLLWKAYLRSDDGRVAGGVYWWADRASAEAKFSEGWRVGVTEKYGSPPTIEWFDAPVVVDPIQQIVRVDAP